MLCVSVCVVKLIFCLLLQINIVYAKAKTDLQTTVKHLQTNAIRYKKKIMLISEERDCFKQLIDNYEKDLTSK